MAQTATQWYAKISKFVPSWYFEGQEQSVCFTRGVFKGLAAVLAQCQQDADDQQAATFIMNTVDVAPITDLHGAERNTPRGGGESDSSYRPRIRDALFKPVGSAELAIAVNAVLHNGVGDFIENSQNGFWDDGNTTAIFWDDAADNARWLDSHKWYNWWTLIVPIQTGGVQADIRTAIVAAIEANKAFGTTYDILYKSTSDTDTED